MRRVPIAILVLSILGWADSSLDARRDAALKAVNACIRRNEVSSRECKKLNANLQTLIDVYNHGDKTVLPILFKFTYLTEFYGDALLSDPEWFLTAMSELPERNQKDIAIGVAGGLYGVRTRERFDTIRALLKNIPSSAPIKKISELCLGDFERQNASFFLSYFPPQTFTSRAADFQLRWYSADMYALGERPLWPASEHETTYRLTYLPAFSDPTVITLIASPGGEWRIAIKAIGKDRETTTLEGTAPMSREQVTRFLGLLDRAHFWTMPTELPTAGTDGAEWIMEGTEGGKYRAVVRWCPDIERQSDEQTAFAEAGRLLFELAGHRHGRGC